MDWDDARESGLIAELERKYLWWRPVSDSAHSTERVIALAMDLGTFDDIRRLEQTFGRCRLAEVMLRAAPGWFSERSWEFWRGRLSTVLARTDTIPEEPPRRSFDAEEI